MARPVSIVELTPSERQELQRRVRAHSVSKRDSLRAQGIKQVQVAEELGVSVACVNKWSRRFDLKGPEGLTDAKGRGRRPSLPLDKVAKVVSEATRPPTPRRRWSVRTMAKAAGMSPDSVHRIWRANEIKPHLIGTLKVSADARFEERFWDVMGLYLDPPERALVLCCDEKSQCQALERTQPGLPLGVGEIRAKTHDYKRHGTITLFAALNYLDGKLIARTEAHHTHVEWLRFLKQTDRETPKDLELHLIMDNYASHKEASVQRWLSRHPRFHLHFTPTSSSWMNLIERSISELTTEVVRDGSFAGVKELVRDIEAYLTDRNQNPKPYRGRTDRRSCARSNVPERLWRPSRSAIVNDT